MNPIKLQEFQLQELPFFIGLPKFDSAVYHGEEGCKRLVFSLKQAEQKIPLSVLTMIRKEEGFLWKSFQELLERTLKSSAGELQGFFGFDLFSVQIFEGLQSFNWGNFQKLVVNHARKLKVGEAQLLQYTSLFGLLTKRVDEMWGKMDCRTSVDIFSQVPDKLDLVFKKIAKAVPDKTESFFSLVMDLSQTPILNLEEGEQRERLRRFLETQKDPAGNLPPHFYFKDRNGTIELGAHFGLRG